MFFLYLIGVSLAVPLQCWQNYTALEASLTRPGPSGFQGLRVVYVLSPMYGTKGDFLWLCMGPAGRLPLRPDPAWLPAWCGGEKGGRDKEGRGAP